MIEISKDTQEFLGNLITQFSKSQERSNTAIQIEELKNLLVKWGAEENSAKSIAFLSYFQIEIDEEVWEGRNTIGGVSSPDEEKKNSELKMWKEILTDFVYQNSGGDSERARDTLRKLKKDYEKKLRKKK